MSRLKKLLKAFHTAAKHNIMGYECVCKCNAASASLKIIYNKQYHLYEYCIACKDCRKTTPAFPTPKQAEDNWEDLWIAEELALLAED